MSNFPNFYIILSLYPKTFWYIFVPKGEINVFTAIAKCRYNMTFTVFQGKKNKKHYRCKKKISFFFHKSLDYILCDKDKIHHWSQNLGILLVKSKYDKILYITETIKKENI